MKTQSRASYLLIGFLIAAILFTLVAAKFQQSHYIIYNYSKRIVKLDREAGDLEIINLTRDVVGNKGVPEELISVDCENATYTKRLFKEK